MPSAADHLKRAEHHCAFLQSIDGDEFTDWMSVAAFYAAVHYVEQLRAAQGEHSADHHDRLEFVKTHHSAIHAHFHKLYRWAWSARYDSGPFLWMHPDHVVALLDEIREYVSSYSPPQ